MLLVSENLGTRLSIFILGAGDIVSFYFMKASAHLLALVSSV